MANKFLGVALALGATAVIAPGALAADNTNITTAEGLKNCLVQAENATCKLGSNIEVAERYILNSDITLDLNGYNITNTATAAAGTGIQVQGHTLDITGEGTISTGNYNSGVIRILGTNEKDATKGTAIKIGKDVTIKGDHGLVVYNNNGTAHNVTVDVAGTIEGNQSGIWTIGTIANLENYPTINIANGAIISASSEDMQNAGVGVSAMGYAKWNIGKAQISGVGSGLGIKAGIINVNGATVMGSGDIAKADLPPALYGNGINASGAAVQIESNSGYAGHIELNIEDGAFISEHTYGIYGYGDKSAAIKVNIAKAYIAGKMSSIGYKTISPEISIANGSALYMSEDGGYITTTVTPIAHIEGVEDDKFVAMDEYDTLDAGEEEKVAAALEEKGIDPEEDFHAYKIYDISVMNKSGGKAEHSAALTFTVDIDPDFIAHQQPEFFTRTWYVMHIHNDEVEFIDCEVDLDNSTITFETDEYSTYILGFTDTEVESPLAPDTGKAATEGTAMSSTALIASVLAGISTTSFSLFYLLRRRS